MSTGASDAVVFVLAGFVVAATMTPAGISGAFLLVPFQATVLGLTSVAVTPTNLLFNLVATPAAIATYRRKGLLDLRLATLITVGSLPGVLVGAWLRMTFFADPSRFRAVVGLVLLALGLSLALDRRTPDPTMALELDRRAGILIAGGAALTGVVGGIYGIGGGAFLAPLLTLATGRSLQRIAGATLVGTLVTSIAGVAAFAVAGSVRDDAHVQPDWTAGLLFGVGGLLGGYVGASLQHRVPERGLRLVLTVVVAGLGLSYLARSLVGG